ncbi:MAG: PQQ-dependent sugar dehydrogenase [Opitutus sp.]
MIALSSAGLLGAAESASGGKYREDPATIERGKAVFEQQCAACHTLAQDSIGPPLGGITTLLSESRLIEWIRDPAKIIGSDDARTAALVQRYKAPMPPFAHLTETDVSAVLAYIDQRSRVQQLHPFLIDPAAKMPSQTRRWAPPVEKSSLVIELEDVAQIPRLPGRTPYKGITLLRPDPREAGALLVDELMGLLYRIKDHQVSVFLDIRELFPEFICDPGVATGLGSFALHPEFVRNGLLYTMHAEKFRGSPVINAGDIPTDVPPSTSPRLEWVLTEWRLTDLGVPAFVGTHREVLRFVTPTTAHAAQEIAFAPTADVNDADYGKLYIAIGDGGSANLKRPDMAGHSRTLLGAILRIDPAGRNGRTSSYGIPADNPFAETADPAIHREIWAFGFRNPHRISWDRKHPRQMIAIDIGESNVEEVNLIEKGGAYGWGAAGVEGHTRVDATVDAKIVRAATAAELADIHLPWGEYDHVDGSAITGGYVYHGSLESLQDKYIFADIVSGRVLWMNMAEGSRDQRIYELNVVRAGGTTSLKALAHAERAHVRVGYDERTGDLYFLTKDDGMIRRVTAADQR